jgi:hypothetical protein
MTTQDAMDRAWRARSDGQAVSGLQVLAAKTP